MATRGRTSKRSTRRTQPKTIDLSAKEVKPSANPEDAGSSPKAAEAKNTATASTKTAGPATAKAAEKPKAAGQTRGGSKSESKSEEKPEAKIPESGKSEPAGSAAASNKVNQRNENNTNAGTSFTALAAAALFGGVVTAVGLGVIGQFQNANSLPLIGSLYSADTDQDGSAAANAANEQIASLRGRLEKIESVPQVDVSSDIARLQAGFESVSAELSKLAESADDQLSALIDSNRQTIQTLSESVEQLKSDAQIAAQTAGEATTQQIDELKQSLDGLSSEFRAFVAENNPIDPQLMASFSEKVTNLENIFAQFRSSQGETVEGLSNNLAELKSQIEKQVLPEFGVIKQAAEQAKDGERVALSVAAASLQTALDSGSNYLGGLASLEALLGPSDETRRLREIAETAAVPDLETLKQDFGSLASAIASSETDSTTSDSMVDRLISGAKTLVSIRPSGPTDGQSPAAIVSRIEDRLNRGDLAAVVEEWQKLPEHNQSIGSAWMEKIKLRMETDQLLKKAIQSATASGGQG